MRISLLILGVPLIHPATPMTCDQCHATGHGYHCLNNQHMISKMGPEWTQACLRVHCCLMIPACPDLCQPKPGSVGFWNRVIANNVMRRRILEEKFWRGQFWNKMTETEGMLGQFIYIYEI